MPRKENRAEIFAPYDSLKGFFDMIHEKERIIVERKELSEDDLQQLDYQLSLVQKGQIIKVIYYDQDDYIQLEGVVSQIDKEYSKTIQIVRTRIPIHDIISIEITQEESIIE